MKATPEKPYPHDFEEFIDWFHDEPSCMEYLEWVVGPAVSSVPDAQARPPGKQVAACGIARIAGGRLLRPPERFSPMAESRCACGFMSCG